MVDRNILSRLDDERRHLARPGEVIDVLPSVTRLRPADGSYYLIAYASIPEADADVAIDREVEHHRRLGAGFEWKVYAHDHPPGLADRLRRHGFDVGPREAVLVYDLAGPPDWRAAAADGVAVVAVERPAQVADYRRVAEAVSGEDGGRHADELTAALAGGSNQVRGYVAYAGGQPVSIGRLYTHPDSWFGGLYGGSTLPAYRGRGFYRAVVAARGRDAAAAGARFLIVDALPTSRPILERMGFRHVTDTWPCRWAP